MPMDAATEINETLAFSDAVQVAIDFYNEHPDETLIIVTGDHETGGLTIGFATDRLRYTSAVPGQSEDVVRGIRRCDSDAA